jgi:hypothetical protein
MRGAAPYAYAFLRLHRRPMDVREGCSSCGIKHKSSRIILYIKVGAFVVLRSQHLVLDQLDAFGFEFA